MNKVKGRIRVGGGGGDGKVYIYTYTNPSHYSSTTAAQHSTAQEETTIRHLGLPFASSSEPTSHVSKSMSILQRVAQGAVSTTSAAKTILLRRTVAVQIRRLGPLALPVFPNYPEQHQRTRVYP